MSRRRDERGAVAIIAAAFIVVIVTVAAFAVDLGMQRVVRRDMQALADVVALDLARELDGRSQSQLAHEIDQSSPTSALSASLARNSSTLGTTPDVDVELGGWDGTLFNPGTDPPTAVRVTASSSVPFAFRSGDGAASRTAVGATLKAACYSVGSFAGRFTSSSSAVLSTLLGPMNSLIRPQANLDVVSYQGIAASTVTLNELVVAGSFGSAQQLLTSTVTGTQLINAAIVVLDSRVPRNSVAIEALNKILNGQAELVTPVLLTDILNVSPSDTAALELGLNVLDLVAGAILRADAVVADGSNGFKVNNGNLGSNIGGVASLTKAEVFVTQAAQTACGTLGSPESEATSSQVGGTLEAKFELPTIRLGGGDIVQTMPATVVATVDVGKAVARLNAEPECNGGTAADPDKTPLEVATALTTFSFTTTLRFRTTLDILGLGRVTVTWSQEATAGQVMPADSEDVVLLTPPNDTVPVETGTGDAGLKGATVSTVTTNVVATTTVLGATVGVDVSLVTSQLSVIAQSLAVNATVDGRLDSLASAIDTGLTPLLTLLGINISGADLYAVGRPVCQAPVLRQ